MKKLKTGDLVKGKLNRETYLVTNNYGGRVTAVRTVDITNPDEWDLILKSNYEKK